jgi:hypothetical protein
VALQHLRDVSVLPLDLAGTVVGWTADRERRTVELLLDPSRRSRF